MKAHTRFVMFLLMNRVPIWNDTILIYENT